MELMRFTPAENREMLRVAGVRDALQRKIAERAVPVADTEVAYAASSQNAKDAVTHVTRFVSVGSQMQHETSRTTRSADRERAAARAKLTEIDRLLADDATTKEERKMLEEMREMSALQEKGASELLAANARITAAGYVIDGALLVSGGALAKGATKLAGGAAGVVAGEGAKTATVALLNRSALELAGQGATKVATSVATRVAGEEAATKVGTLLAADVSTPAAQMAGAAARRMVGDKAVDATVAFTARAAEVATTNVSDVPTLVREAAAGRTAAAEARAATTATAAAREAATPPAATPARVANRNFSPEELEILHQPGRNLTPEQTLRKGELYRRPRPWKRASRPPSSPARPRSFET